MRVVFKDGPGATRHWADSDLRSFGAEADEFCAYSFRRSKYFHSAMTSSFSFCRYSRPDIPPPVRPKRGLPPCCADGKRLSKRRRFVILAALV